MLAGLGGRDTLRGYAGADSLDGGAGRDTMNGGAGADTLTGGTGRDTMTGGTGADTFVFTAPGDTGNTNTTRDRITDFSQADGDIIDLSAIDADVNAPGNQAFTFLGTAAFSGFEAQLRYVQTAAKTILQADIDGDGAKDFQIELVGVHTLTAGDFVL